MGKIYAKILARCSKLVSSLLTFSYSKNILPFTLQYAFNSRNLQKKCIAKGKRGKSVKMLVCHMLLLLEKYDVEAIPIIELL